MAAILLLLTASPALAEDIGSVGYRFKWLGPKEVIYFLARRHRIRLYQVLLAPFFALSLPIALFAWELLCFKFLVVITQWNYLVFHGRIRAVEIFLQGRRYNEHRTHGDKDGRNDQKVVSFI